MCRVQPSVRFLGQGQHDDREDPAPRLFRYIRATMDTDCVERLRLEKVSYQLRLENGPIRLCEETLFEIPLVMPTPASTSSVDPE